PLLAPPPPSRLNQSMAYWAFAKNGSRRTPARIERNCFFIERLRFQWSGRLTVFQLLPSVVSMPPIRSPFLSIALPASGSTLEWRPTPRRRHPPWRCVGHLHRL